MESKHRRWVSKNKCYCSWTGTAHEIFSDMLNLEQKKSSIHVGKQHPAQQKQPRARGEDTSWIHSTSSQPVWTAGPRVLRASPKSRCTLHSVTMVTPLPCCLFKILLPAARITAQKKSVPSHKDTSITAQEMWAAVSQAKRKFNVCPSVPDIRFQDTGCVRADNAVVCQQVFWAYQSVQKLRRLLSISLHGRQHRLYKKYPEHIRKSSQWLNTREAHQQRKNKGLSP